MASLLPGSDRELQEALRRVETELRAGNVTQAMRAARDASARGLVHPNLLTLAAVYEIEMNAPQKALAFATRARELAPRRPEVLQAQAMALSGVGRHQEAVAIYDEALRHGPAVANLRYNKGLALEELHQWARAQREFERTIDLEPAHAGALARLASAAMTRGDDARAREFAQKALRSKPGQPASLITLAQLELNARNFPAARDLVAPLLKNPSVSPVNRSLVLGLLADALDGEGKPADAFARYVESNLLLREVYRLGFEGPGIERALKRVQRLSDYMSGCEIERWRNCDAGTYRPPVGTHVFLVGFPRSGTTLLEQVLASHDEIESLEERDCLMAAMTDFVAPPDGMARLAQLGGDDLSRYRQDYWAQARAAGAMLDRRVFVDKMPLNAISLPVVAKLFPAAKILLAVRDPRDVVLSCFRRRFRMSAHMYEFLTLESAARYYAAVMEFCEICRDRLTLDSHVSRYEQLVDEFEARARALCAFLGVAFDGSMAAFAQKTRDRAIYTPSRAQVVQGLYRSGMGQWRAYRDHLATVLPLLAPFVSRYGYEEH